MAEQKKKRTTKKKESKKEVRGRKSKAKREARVKKEEGERKVERKEKKAVKSVLKKGDEERIVYARGKYIQMSAQKTRLVVDLVRGEGAYDAIARLDFVNKRAALPVKKAIKSAVANAENNFEMEGKKLVIKEAFVDDAPIYKRWRAGSRGRYKKVLKRNCHITIGVSEEK